MREKPLQNVSLNALAAYLIDVAHKEYKTPLCEIRGKVLKQHDMLLKSFFIRDVCTMLFYLLNKMQSYLYVYKQPYATKVYLNLRKPFSFFAVRTEVVLHSLPQCFGFHFQPLPVCSDNSHHQQMFPSLFVEGSRNADSKSFHKEVGLAFGLNLGGRFNISQNSVTCAAPKVVKPAPDFDNLAEGTTSLTIRRR